jgi:hypothetical protein
MGLIDTVISAGTALLNDIPLIEPGLTWRDIQATQKKGVSTLLDVVELYNRPDKPV